MNRLRMWWRLLLLFVFRRPMPIDDIRQELPPAPEPLVMPELPPPPNSEAAPTQATEPPAAPAPPLAPVPPPMLTMPVYILPPHRKEKWVTPKVDGAPPSPSRHTVLHRAPKPWAPPKPTPATPVLTEDPEQWGQYYFRDAILDQLDRYWIYLRRMKRGDADAYGLLRQVGIQMVPWSATRNFDILANDSDIELSPWWRNNRPAFGAIAYGFDEVANLVEGLLVADQAEPSKPGRKPIEPPHLKGAVRRRPFVISNSSADYDRRKSDKPSVIWAPRFLYFQKWQKPPLGFEQISGGDTYSMTVYWDRCDKNVAKRWRAKNRGGVPQEYGVWIEHKTGRVRVLKSKIHERVEIKWSKGPYGGKCLEPTSFIHTHWDVPDRYLSWSHREINALEPEDYLRRLFIEAACMYESAALGSMVRIAVSKGDLTCTFGVAIKRMAHFFKDRDVALTVKGARRPVLHLVRPHVRKNGADVKMHFRGMREFTWAGYRVSVTVPGRDHSPLPEFDIGAHNTAERGERMLDTEKLGQQLVSIIKTGVGGTHPR